MKRLLVLTLGAAALAFGLGQWAQQRTIARQYREVVMNQRTLELENGQLRGERDRLSQELAGEHARVDDMTASLAGRASELQLAMDRVSQEERIIQELQGRLLAMQVQFDRLQGELAVALDSHAAPAKAGRQVELEKVVVTHAASAIAPGLQGRIVSINPEWRFVVIDLGWDVINIGDIVSIFRDDSFLGKARVERVQEQVSAASLLPEWVETEVQVNDVVRIL
jgi:hypothetical protein